MNATIGLDKEAEVSRDEVAEHDPTLVEPS